MVELDLAWHLEEQRRELSSFLLTLGRGGAGGGGGGGDGDVDRPRPDSERLSTLSHGRTSIHPWPVGRFLNVEANNEVTATGSRKEMERESTKKVDNRGIHAIMSSSRRWRIGRKGGERQ
ncbi:hypothetical protein GALMADRAFT_230909 [Galerina marginata CBS 339.88]|uniref:Uncharacterized protein n=1 Tax=Galerina marginata (strain CBS 339.88) TaxID=685588 RepID=A0A067SN50_GALM3|nr:hypothetical protein GALMADRAFT_230909 [Galerina marginata CBS 339.88]